MSVFAWTHTQVGKCDSFELDCLNNSRWDGGMDFGGVYLSEL